MNRITFSPEIEQAIAQAFELHKQGKCETDCGFCHDLVLSGLPSAPAELKRIHQLRLERQKKPVQKPLTAITPPKRVGKGEKSPLAGRVKR